MSMYELLYTLYIFSVARKNFNLLLFLSKFINNPEEVKQ